MALARDATTHTGFGDSSQTFSHTCGASANLLVVMLMFADADDEPTGITYNGVALTKATGGFTSPVGGDVWYLANPATGAAHDVVISCNGTIAAMVGVYSFSGASSTLGTVAWTTATTNDPSLSVSSASGDIVLSALVVDAFAGAITVSGGGTTEDEWEGGPGGNTFGFQSKTASGSSTTMSWTASLSGARWGGLGVAVKAPSGGTAALGGSALTPGSTAPVPSFSITL